MGYSNNKAQRTEELEETLHDIELQKKIEESEISDNNRESSVKAVRNNVKKFRMKKFNIYQKAREKNWRKAKV